MNRKFGRWGSITLVIFLFIYVVAVYQSLATIYLEQEGNIDRNKLNDEFTHAYFTPGEKVINPIDEKYLINGETICDSISPNSVIILIPSIKIDLDFRNLLRRTWLGALLKDEWPNENLGYEFKVAFIFGKGVSYMDNQALQMENFINGDIVQGSFVDSYHNLTRKTLFGLKWVTKYCSGARYVMKIDVDTFAHVPKLLRKITFYEDNPDGKIFGRLWEKSEPHRSGRWKIEYKDYPPINYYPPYCDGPIYVISGSAVPRLVYVSERMPYLQLEDVFVTGIVAKIAKINRINVLQNVNFRDSPEWVCSFRMATDSSPVHIADSDYSQKQIEAIWKCMKDGPNMFDYFKYYFDILMTNIFKILGALLFIVGIVLALLLNKNRCMNFK